MVDRETEQSGNIADNIMHFARLLRSAGLQVGSGQIIDAINAVMVAGLACRSSLYWALRTALLKRQTQYEIFDQAFVIFWRDPALLKCMMTLLIPQTQTPQRPEQRDNMARRLAETLSSRIAELPRPGSVDMQAGLCKTFSAAKTMRQKDFAQMSAAELRHAKTAIRSIRIVREQVRTRRYKPLLRGRQVDLRAVLRGAALKGPDYLLLYRKERRLRRPPLVVLCDISGSMDQYARIFLHFLYTLQDNRDRVFCFLFATGLHNVTRMLQNRDPDVAIASVGTRVTDWSGGTRLGHCIHDFNQHWARRVLGQNAQVLLFTDGLDRDAGDGMDIAMRRLNASCRRLIWVNPLLRYDKYKPIAAGARILHRYAHETRSCHNVESLTNLALALNGEKA